jgi:hypothetical protein
MKIKLTLFHDSIHFFRETYLHYSEINDNKIPLYNREMSTTLRKLTMRLKIKAIDED